MKRKLSILIALVMAISLLMVPAAVSADPGATGAISFQKDGQGKVEWSTENPLSGIYSVRLELPAPIENVDEARVKFGYDGTLNSLTEMSFNFMLEQCYGVWQSYPYMTFSMDMDDDGEADAWGVAGWDTPLGELGTWYFYTLTEGSLLSIAAVKTGGLGEENWYSFPAMPFSALKQELQPESDLTWGECTVLEVKIGVGNCGSVKDTTVIAFVDDVTINDVLYNLEAPSGTVQMIATYPAPVIGIEVSPGSVSFGDVEPGTLALGHSPVTVTNTGNVVEDFSADIINEFPAGVYTAELPNGLKMQGPGDIGSVSAWGAPGVIPAEGADPPGSVVVLLTLMVPEGAPYGTYHATLIFWAEQAGP